MRRTRLLQLILLSVTLMVLMASQLAAALSSPNGFNKEQLVREKLKAKEAKTPKKYYEWKGELVSERLVNTFEGDGYIVKVYEVTFRMEKPKLEELIHNSKEYFDSLIKTYGDEGKAIVGRIIEDWKAWLDSIKGETYEVKAEVARISLKDEGTISFDVNLYKWWFGWQVSDPVNLVFYGPAGSAWDVDYDMRNWLTNKWGDAGLAWDLYTWVDKDHADGVDWVWKKQDYQLRHGDYYGYCYHIRIYDGGYDWDQFLEWCIAGVHYEVWDWLGLTHRVISWEQAEDFVRSDFADEWFVGGVGYVYLFNARPYQDIWNDGYATIIRLDY